MACRWVCKRGAWLCCLLGNIGAGFDGCATQLKTSKESLTLEIESLNRKLALLDSDLETADSKVRS